MSKPIFLTESIISEMTKEFVETVRGLKMSDGNVTYTKKFTYEDDDPITILFTPIAFAKMVMLLQDFSSEVAWHGVVDRIEDGFVITDILVYPQEVSGTTVNTDQEGYQKWMMELDDVTANHLHMQGHSHVNMSTSPSGVDTNHQEAIVSQLNGKNFYIFMIWNKSLKHTVKVYDFANNTMYEDSDVSIRVAGTDCDLDQFIKDANSVVKTKSYSYTAPSYGGAYDTKKNPVVSGKDEKKAADAGKGKKEKKAKDTSKLGSGFQNRSFADEDVDYDEMIFGHRT